MLTTSSNVLVALTRFRRTLKYARIQVRMLTHTLHLPPALSEIYGGPRPEWLRDLLVYLPCLQSLIVSKLPFFDHNAMTALARYGQSIGTYNIRLLVAEHEPNTTSQGLADALLHFQELVYLDLSHTPAARDGAVLSSLSQLEHLQVLKLRGIGLKDKHAEFLANAIGSRVRFLDLRNNILTDMAVRSLLQGCFVPYKRPSLGNGARVGSWTSANDVPPFTLNPSHSLFRKSDIDEEFMKTLTQPFTGRSWVENVPHGGITHLLLADNQITVEAVASLLSSEKLHLLDVGTVDTAASLNRQTQSFSPPTDDDFPGAEKLIPILRTAAKDNLAYFRAHHAVVTAETPIKDISVSKVFLPELPGTIPDAAPEANHEMAELNGVDEVHELPADTTPIFELEDTSVPQPTEPIPPVGVRSPVPHYEDEPLPSLRRGSIYAPEVVEPMPVEKNDDTPILSPGGSGAPMNVSHLFSGALEPVTIESPHGQKIQELLNKRPNISSLPRRDGKDPNIVPYLHPSHVPHLETLVLTDVPSHVPVNSPVLTSLLRFITACSNEALLASLQAGSDYSLPPGQSRFQAEQAKSRSHFSLSRLVLEITPLSELKRAAKLSPWKAARLPNGAFKSSIGDRDLDNMWSAAEDDFSFFETECGLPANDPGRYSPMAALNEKVSLIPEDDDGSPGTPELLQPTRSHSQRTRSQSNSTITAGTGRNSPSQQVEAPTVDLVAELAAFRRAKKAEYEVLVRNDRRRRRSTNTTMDSKTGMGLGLGMGPGPWNPTATTVTSPSRLSASPSLSNQPRSPSPILSVPQLAMAHYVEGYWKGEVKIVRNPTPKGRSGMVDMYGNYFEKGYLYP